MDGNRKRIYKAVEFIEGHLSENIDLGRIAAESALSEFHFHRLFHLLIGETPIDYLRKRRLYEAAVELAGGTSKVIDVALNYGYSSSDAFSRAFRKHFGFAPRQVKANNDRLIPFPKPRLLLSAVEHIHKGVSMEPTIKHLDSFNLIGVVYYGDNKNDEIPAFWEKHFGIIDGLPERVSIDCYGFCFHTSDYIESGKFHYMPAVEVSSLENIPLAGVGKTVPAHEYAIFTHKGSPDTLKATYDYIYGTWFPNQRYEKNEAFDFELYTSDKDGNDIIELYVPVVRK